MALVLFRLKLAIQRRAFGTSGTAQRVLLVVGWLLGLALGIVGGAIYSEAASARTPGGDVIVLAVYGIVFMGWLLAPLFLPGMSDDAVDPARLEQYPLTSTQQVVGLFLGSLFAPTVLFTILTAAGGATITGENWAEKSAVLLSALLFSSVCVASSRAAQAWIGAALNSRRGRDASIVITATFGLVLLVITQRAGELATLAEGSVASVPRALLWLPTGSTAAAALAARDGRWPSYLTFTLVSIAYLSGALVLWSLAVERRATSSGSRLSARRASAGTERLDLIVPFLAFLAPTAVLAAASQHLRYYFFRLPKASQAVMITVAIAAISCHTLADESGLVFATLFMVPIVAVTASFTVFAYDGSGLMYLVASGQRMREVLLGKSLAATLMMAAAMLLFVAVEVPLTGEWSLAPSALLEGLGGAVFAGGLGAVFSVLFPFDFMVARRGRPRFIAGSMIGLTVLLLAMWGLSYAKSTGFFQALPPGLGSVLVLLVGTGLGLGFVRIAGNLVERRPGRIAESVGLV